MKNRKRKKISSSMKNYFPLPNQIFSLGLDAGEIAVLAYLMYCEDRSTFQCHPSYTTIGEAIKKSKNTVAKYVKSLEDKHFIYTEHTTVTLKNGKKQNGNLIYTIRPIQDAVDFYNQQQMSLAILEKEKRRVSLLMEEFNKVHPPQDEFDASELEAG